MGLSFSYTLVESIQLGLLKSYTYSAPNNDTYERYDTNGGRVAFFQLNNTRTSCGATLQFTAPKAIYWPSSLKPIIGIHCPQLIPPWSIFRIVQGQLAERTVDEQNITDAFP